MKTVFGARGFAASVVLGLMAWAICNVARAAPTPVPAGALTAQYVHFQYAVYYLPVPSQDPLRRLQAVLEGRKAPPRQLTAAVPKTPKAVTLSARLEKDVKTNYPVPDSQMLQYFGRGMTAQQAQALQSSREAIVLDFAHPASSAVDGIRAANEIVEALARDTGGLIWDEETREVFSPDAWREHRMASWTSPWPEASRQITIHAYKDKEFVRAITLGMAKFGLPDVVVQNFSWSVNRPMGNLLNAVAQALVEGSVVTQPGRLDFDLRGIKNDDVRKSIANSLKPNTSGVAELTITQGIPQQGDPKNRLVEVGFDRYAGPDHQARYTAFLMTLFGSEETILRARHDAELLEASRKARSRLPELRTRFNRGLAPGEFIQLKAPFKVPTGGNEYMWVEVATWKGNAIAGMLKNEPAHIPGLHGGQMVEIKEDDVFDYYVVRPDGTREGNETSKILEKIQARTR